MNKRSVFNEGKNYEDFDENLKNKKKKNKTSKIKNKEIEKIIKSAKNSFKNNSKFILDTNAESFERAIKNSKPPEVKFPSIIEWLPNFKKHISINFFFSHFIGGCLVGNS